LKPEIPRQEADRRGLCRHCKERGHLRRDFPKLQQAQSRQTPAANPLSLNGNVSQTWKFGEKVFDASERVIEHHVEQEVKRVKAPRKENEPIHGYSAFERFLELAKVMSPTGVVRVH
jgi:hypothetical protein